MTREEINQKTSLCFLLNSNIPEEEKICVIEKVMATKATIVPKAALCNIITYILKQMDKQRTQLIEAIELIKNLSSSLSVVGECEEEECELLNRAEQFISEVE